MNDNKTVDPVIDKQNRLKKWALNFLAVIIGTGFVLVVLGILEIYSQYQLKKTNEAFCKFYDPGTSRNFPHHFVGGHYSVTFKLDPLVAHGRDIEDDPQIIGMTRTDVVPNITRDNATIYFRRSYLFDKKSEILEEKNNLTPEFISALQRPLIITLGGSTTAHFEFPDESSWPEELSRLLDENNLQGTVINFGGSAYKSSQEMLIFIRDVLQLKPDIVISYDGVNEVFNFWEDYPIYSNYITNIYNYVLNRNNSGYSSSVLPNTITYLTRFLSINKKKDLKVFYGVKSHKTTDEVLLENWSIIKAICDSRAIRYYCVLQPFSCNSEKTTTPELLQRHWKGKFGGDPKIRKDLIQMCKVVKEKMKDHHSFCDFTTIFDNDNPKDIFIWEDDTCHVSQKGNRIIAKHMFKMLFEDKTTSIHQEEINETITK